MDYRILTQQSVREISVDPHEDKIILKQNKQRLSQQQLLIKEHNLPVLVLVEGWGTAGKGSLISTAIEELDPRFFEVLSVSRPTEEELRKPFLWRHFVNIPESGKISFLDSGWMDETLRQELHGELTSKEYQERILSINTFERQLTDNGYLLIKVFLQIGKKEQSRRIEKLSSNPDTCWRVSENDMWQNTHYKTCINAFDCYLAETNTSYAPWHIVESSSKKEAEFEIYDLLTKRIDEALEAKASGVKPEFTPIAFPIQPLPLLSQVTLDKSISDEDYKKELKHCQKTLRALHNILYRRKIPVVICYEGWDAAGKGGNVKRITNALDARGFQVIPIASPDPHELARHYLWRFWNKLPKNGHIVIFDRTWYGRVLVERIEGFCSKEDWTRAYTEINEFEKELTDWGAVVVKFWVHIDQETQLKRFTMRQNSPEKQWKITPEDWRNREKWEEYEEATNEMLQKTSTKSAPWHIIQSVDKKYARIQTLHILIDALEAALY